MANFSPTKFTFGSTIANKQANKAALEENKRQATDKAFAESLQQDLTNTAERVKDFIDIAVQQIEAGATNEQIEPTGQVVGQLVDSFAARIAELKGGEIEQGRDASQVDSALQSVQQLKQFYEESVKAAQLQREDTSEDFETLSPEEVAAANLPEGSLAQRGPDDKITLTFDPTENPSALEERVNLLETIPGLDDETIAAIAGGLRAVGIDPISRERFVMDLATGEEIGAREPIDTSEADVPSLIPEDIDTDIATGVPGALKNAANIITDAVGAGVNFPKAQEATEALNSVQVLTTITLQAEVPGRPSKFLLERLEGLTVKPNSLFQGEERAKTRLEQTRRLLDGEIQRMEKQVLPLELDPKTRVETQLNLTQMKRLRDAYDDLLKGFETGEEEEIDPAVKAALDKHAPIDSESESE